MKRKNRGRDVTHFLFMFPSLVLYSLLTVIPILAGVYYSMTDWNGIAKDYHITGFANYLKAFQDSRFLKSLVFNLRYAVLLTVCVLVLSIALGLLLNAPIKGRTFFRALYFFPAVISMITIGLIFNEIYSRGVPVLAVQLGIGFLKKNILSSVDTAIYGVLIANVWKSVSIPTVLVLSGLQTIPQEIIESARLDGATRWQEFRFITVPYLLPILSIIMVLTLKEGLMVYDYIIALTQGGPAGATESITLLLYRLGFEELQFNYSITLSLVVSVIIFSLSLIQITFTNQKRVY